MSIDSDPVNVPEASKKRKSDRTPEERAAKKARKEARKASKAAEPSTAPANNPDNDAVEAYLKDNEISFDPADALAEFAPILDFASLEIDDRLRAGLTTFSKPTPVQACTWGILLKGRDTVGIAETGSGKTMAFGLPAIKHLQGLSPDVSDKKKKQKRGPVSVLVLAPTRELAMQTHESLHALGQLCGFSAVCVYGGVPKPPQLEALKKGARIVVGTPGRILDLCNEAALDLGHVSYLVLDEADRMLDAGFENDVRSIISKTRGMAEGRQTAMFSATWPASVRRLAADFMSAPIKITVGSDDLTASASVHQTVVVLEDGRMKEQKLLQTLRENGWTGKSAAKQGDKVLVFALYKKEASRVEAFLKRNGYTVSCLQGDMSQQARTQALSDFKTGVTTLLVATDVAARGLDIPKVELVINQTFPLTIEDYIHRIGRTGRAGRKGKAITFFTAEDSARAGELQRVLREGGMDIPEALKAFGGTIKKKVHATYGAHYNEELAGKKGTKITFD